VLLAAPATMGRLVGAETRKALTSRATRILLGLCVLIAFACATGYSATHFHHQPGAPLGWDEPASMTGLGSGLLAPVIITLLVTTEFSSRLSLTTFTLEPRRGRVITAKAALAGAVTAAVFTLTHALAALTSLTLALAGHTPIDWALHPAHLAGQAATTSAALAMAFAFAVALRHTAAALVAYFAVPTLTQILTLAIPHLANHLGWISLAAAEQPLTSGHLTTLDLAHLATSAVLYITLPLLAGIWRLTHTDLS